MKRSTVDQRLKHAVTNAQLAREWLKLYGEYERGRTPLRATIDTGEWLATWLNFGREEGGDKTRIKELIALLQKLEGLLRSARGTPIWKLPEVNTVEAELNKLTRKYTSWLRFGPESDASGIGVAHMWLPGSGSLGETQALKHLERLAAAGLLERLAMCAQCGERWIFRSKATKLHCSLKCRQKRYESTPERKAARKTYYIPSERRQGNAKKKKAAKRSL
jgi:hypothetical protein